MAPSISIVEYEHEQDGVECFLCYREEDPKMTQS